MAFFHISKASKNNNSSVTEQKPQKPSVRDLYARTFNVWCAEGSAEPRRHSSGFEAERARRASQDNGDLVMRS